MNTSEFEPDADLDPAEMRMLWNIAVTLAENAAEHGRDVASFHGFALTAKRLAVSNTGLCLVRIVILYGGAARRALQTFTWEEEDELEAVTLTMPLPPHVKVGPFPGEEVHVAKAGTDVRIHAAADADAAATVAEPGKTGHRPTDSRWLCQPVRCTSRIDQTGMISRDPVAARPGGVRSQVRPAGESAPRKGVVLPMPGLPRV
jgi:hypothetical protein